MERIKFLILLQVIVWGMLSCQKEISGLQAVSVLSENNEVKVGEPVTVTFPGIDSGIVVNWQVSPDSLIQLLGNGPVVTIYFEQPGTYLVNGTANGNNYTQSFTVLDRVSTSDTASVNPTDTAMVDSSGYVQEYPVSVLLTEDQLLIEPSLTDSAGITTLYLTVRTRNSYNCLNSYFMYYQYIGDGSFGYEFFNVMIPVSSACEPGSAPVKVKLRLSPVSEGEHGFSIKLNGIEYSGSLTKLHNKYRFDWNYTEGVTISPKVLE